MRYVSLDIETTGLGDNCQILQLAAVLDDTNKLLTDSLTFNALVYDYWYGGEPFALALNHKIFETLSKCKPGDISVHNGKTVLILEPHTLIPAFSLWLKEIGEEKILLAGKNVASFDLRFLKNMEGWSDVKHHYRFLDPGNLFLLPTDTIPPSTDECLKRAGIKKEVSHDALDDAYDVCMLIRNWILRTERL